MSSDSLAPFVSREGTDATEKLDTGVVGWTGETDREPCGSETDGESGVSRAAGEETGNAWRGDTAISEEGSDVLAASSGGAVTKEIEGRETSGDATVP
jgi:hypothetical protein